jgi:hypothetical protein
MNKIAKISKTLTKPVLPDNTLRSSGFFISGRFKSLLRKENIDDYANLCSKSI